MKGDAQLVQDVVTAVALLNAALEDAWREGLCVLLDKSDSNTNHPPVVSIHHACRVYAGAGVPAELVARHR